MRKRYKLQIQYGRILGKIQAIIFSPILLPIVIVGTVCFVILTHWARYRHWLVYKLDTPKKK